MSNIFIYEFLECIKNYGHTQILENGQIARFKNNT